MNIAVVDDLKADYRRLKLVLDTYATDHHLNFDVTTFSSAEDFLVNYVPMSFSVIFMDIYMTGLTGIDAARIVRKKNDDAIIVFLTSSGDHMLEAFDVHAYGYMLKPLDYRDLAGDVEKIMDDIMRSMPTGDRSLSFSHNRQNLSIAYSDIVCIKSDSHNIEITSASGEVFRPRLAFSTISERLSDDKRFLLINRGIMVNMDYITDFTDEACVLSDDIRLPLNVKKRRQLDMVWQNYRLKEKQND